jgi:hypothetical protein
MKKMGLFMSSLIGPFEAQYASYHERGISIVPIIVGTKATLVKEWSTWCTEKQDIEMLSNWSREYPGAGIGLCCGPRSNVTALDIDFRLDDPADLLVFEQLEELIPTSPLEKKGSKGFTRLYRHEGQRSQTIKISKNDVAFEVLATGRQTVLPDTIHPETGQPYFWTGERLLDIDVERLPNLPSENVEQMQYICKKLWRDDTSGRAGASGRNEALKAQVFAALSKAKEDAEIVQEILEFDRRAHNPPLFSDPNEPQMRRHSPEENALRFVASIRRFFLRRVEEGVFEDPACGLPEIVLTGRQLREVVDDARSAIALINEPPKYYRRAGQMAHLVPRMAGREIADVRPDDLLPVMTRAADWFRINKDGDNVAAKPDKDAIRCLIAVPDENLPVLNQIVRAPLMSSNGQLITTPGYWADEEIFYDDVSGLAKVEIPAVPRAEDVECALNLFKHDLLIDFPFASIADICHVLSAILLPFVRRMINGPTPLHAVNAPTPGSGKTLIAELISIIATGEVVACQTVPDNEEEMRKRITAELGRGLAVILFDNVPNGEHQNSSDMISSATLAGALTAEYWTDRQLGVSRMVQYRNNALWMLTGNNICLSMELVRRSVRIELVPASDKPWKRLSDGFKHPDIKTWAKKNRAELVRSALVLVQNWIAVGMPDGKRTLGSFERWSKVIGGILECAGVDGFLQEQDKFFDDADVEGNAWREFVKLWWDKFSFKPQKVADLRVFCSRHGLMAQTIGDRSVPSQNTRLGKALYSVRNRIYGNLKICLAEDNGHHGKLYALVLQESKVQSGDGQPKSTDVPKHDPTSFSAKESVPSKPVHGSGATSDRIAGVDQSAKEVRRKDDESPFQAQAVAPNAPEHPSFEKSFDEVEI